MRVRASDGRVVRLLHFRYCAKHLALILELQSEIPNVKIDARDEVTHAYRQIPAFQLNLERVELAMLNP